MRALHNKKVDLVVVCQVFYPELVSTGQTLTELAEELAAQGLNIVIIAAQPTLLSHNLKVPQVLQHQGLTILRTWSTRLPKTAFLGKLLNLTTFFMTASATVFLNYRHERLLLLTNPPYLPLLGWACSLIRNQPFGVVLFDIMPEQAELLDFIRPNGFLARAWRWLNCLWYRRANYAVVLSHDMLEGALRNANLLGSCVERAARAKTRVVHVWSDDRIVTPRPKRTSQEADRLGVQNRFVVQYSGNHGRFHDIETLLNLAVSFSPSDGIVFQFIGEGQKKRLVQQRLISNPQAPLYSSGYVSKELLADSLAMSDIGVVAQMPGQERVCYPSKLLGIMAAGRATLAICPENCEMARMIRDHELGFVVLNGDVPGGRQKLLEAKADPERVHRMGENASRFLRKHFTLAQAAKAYHQIILGSDSVADSRDKWGPVGNNPAKPKPLALSAPD